MNDEGFILLGTTTVLSTQRSTDHTGPRLSEDVSKQLRESRQKIRNNRQTVVIVNMIHCCQEYKLLTLPYITLVNKVDMLRYS